jgi:hypothetical protein
MVIHDLCLWRPKWLPQTFKYPTILDWYLIHLLRQCFNNSLNLEAGAREIQMKYLKMCALAALAVAALMAFLGAGTASATVACKTQMTEGCAASGWAYPIGTKGRASLAPLAEGSTTATLEVGTTVLDTCTGSTVESTLASQGSGEPGESENSTITWTGCTRTTNTLEAGSAVVEWIAGTDNATFKTKNTRITVATIFGSCIYGFGEEAKDIGTAIGGNPGSLTITSLIPKLSGNCPGTSATFTAKYVATEPTIGYASNS